MTFSETTELECWLRVSVDPIGKPRMTQRDRWLRRPSTDKYWAYAARLRDARVHIVVPHSIAISFTIAMPVSWSMKKRRSLDGQPHRQKPDIDNLVKGVLDALMDDDKGVWRLFATKHWGQDGMVVIRELT